MSYANFRTGLTFADLDIMAWGLDRLELLTGVDVPDGRHDHRADRRRRAAEQDAAYRRGEYMFVSRGTVLGRWHQIKREMYAAQADPTQDARDFVAELEDEPKRWPWETDPLPF